MKRHRTDSSTEQKTMGAAICHRLTPHDFIAVISPSADRRPKCSSTVVSTLTGITKDRVNGMLRAKIFMISAPEMPRDM